MILMVLGFGLVMAMMEGLRWLKTLRFVTRLLWQQVHLTVLGLGHGVEREPDRYRQLVLIVKSQRGEA
jgi:hypothetical protein